METLWFKLMLDQLSTFILITIIYLLILLGVSSVVIPLSTTYSSNFCSWFVERVTATTTRDFLINL